ncbi:MAG TPA: sigma-70 family RNA polymerase sigma factor [Anaerolineaceae bacterium]|nr:sigma-70 family RNA polymerase sigma factor [Anaerolineaceae bacterium]
METSQEAIQDQGEDNLAITAVSDVQAFSRLYDVYFPRLFKYILFRVYDEHLADDLVSDVFERLLNQLPRFIPGKAPFSAWVFGIARHVVADALRRRSRQRWLSLESLSGHSETESPVEKGLEEHDQVERLRGALRTLTSRENDLVSLKFSSGLTNRQIAALTGLRENNVGIILFRALTKLRHEMTRQEE